MPSCHKKAANTALRHSATEGDKASFTGSFLSYITDVEEERARIIGMLSLEEGESERLDLKDLPLSFLMDFGDILHQNTLYIMNQTFGGVFGYLSRVHVWQNGKKYFQHL